MEETQTESTAFDWNEFSQRTWVVVVAGLLLPPLGIFLSWRKTDWAPKAKWIATGLMGLLFFGQIGAREKKESDRGDITNGVVDVKQQPAEGSPSVESLEKPVGAAEPAKDFQTLADRIEREKRAKQKADFEAQFRPVRELSLGERYKKGYEAGLVHGKGMLKPGTGVDEITWMEKHFEKVVERTSRPGWSKGDAEEARGALDGYRAGLRK